MPAPESGTPFPKIEVPERVVDAGRFPIEDARELVVDDEELILMDVAMNEDMPMSSARVEELGPSTELLTAAEAIGCLSRGFSCGPGVERSAEPAHVRTVVMCGRSGSGQVGWGDVMPSSDGAAELVEHDARIVWTNAMESRHGGERERIDRVIPPLAGQARNYREPGRLERTVRGQLAFKPLDVVRLARKQKGTVVGEKDVLVPSGEVDGEGRVTDFDETPEASELRWNEHRPQGLPDN
jgi:hypothetical protein